MPFRAENRTGGGLAEDGAPALTPPRRSTAGRAGSGAGSRGRRRAKGEVGKAGQAAPAVLTPEMLEAARVPRGRSSAGKPGTRQLRRKH